MTTPLSPQDPPPLFAPDMREPWRFLAACPAYRETPLVVVEGLAAMPVWAKDETQRMGLGAFKALGGVYAVAKLIAAAWEAERGCKLAPEALVDPAVKAFAASLTFVCASAGNHGMAVAAGARLFGAAARIHLSRDVPAAFERRLKEKEATVVRSGATYEESIAAAIADAEATGAIHLADGSWPGYLGPPALVMEGYTVIAEELRRHFDARGAWPSHVFLQAGVGGLAAAMAHAIRETWAEQPGLIVVEPEAAACLQRSHEAGRPTRAEGPVSTMGRLDCKEPSLLAHDTLQRCDVDYVTVSGASAEEAARDLDAKGLSTTPSGAAGLAGLKQWQAVQPEPAMARPLILVTEGAL